jgi:MFS family permease
VLTLLKDRQFRIFWLAGASNDLGMITYITVHGWLALQISDSPFWVGATAGMSGLTLTLFAALSGVLVDRSVRRRLVVAAMALRAAMAVVMAVLILSGNVRLWHVLAVASIEGVLVSVYIPSMLTLTLDIVGKPRLMSATAARFAAMLTMGIVAPLLAGFIVSRFDIGWAYVIVAIGYSGGIVAMLMLRPVRPAPRPRTSPLQDLWEGVAYVFGTPSVRMLITMILVTEAFGWAHETILPVMARDVLHAGASGLGYLLAAGSAGGTVATLFMASRGDDARKSRLLFVGGFGFGVFLVLFAWSSTLWLSLLILAAAYAFVVVYETTVTTLLQTEVPDELRGRVVSFQAMMWGVTGLAGFHTGAIAMAFGAPVAIGMGGAVVVVSSVVVLWFSGRFDRVPEVSGAVG